MKTHQASSQSRLWIRSRRSLLLFCAFLCFCFLTANQCLSQGENFEEGQLSNQPSPPAFSLPIKLTNEAALEFMALGDTGMGNSGQRVVAKQMSIHAKLNPMRFVLFLGDNFYQDGVSSVNDSQWQTKFEKIYSGAGLQVPFYVALGNHDYHQNPQAQVEYSNISSRWKMPARYYHFQEPINAQSSAEFFVLDTTPLAYDKDNGIQKDILRNKGDTAQATWLETALKKSTAQWKIVMGHHPLYSSGKHGDSSPMILQIEKILISHKVNLYLSGHDHNFEIIKPIQGVRYVISGAGAATRNLKWRDNTEFASTRLGFARFTLTAKEMWVQYINRQGYVEYATRLAISPQSETP